MNNEKAKLEVNVNPDYEGFFKHLELEGGSHIPKSFNELIALAKLYNCEIPVIENGKLVWARDIN